MIIDPKKKLIKIVCRINVKPIANGFDKNKNKILVINIRMKDIEKIQNIVYIKILVLETKDSILFILSFKKNFIFGLQDQYFKLNY